MSDSRNCSSEVYTQIAAKLEAIHPTLHWRRLANWSGIIVGLVQGQSVQLSQSARHIPQAAQDAGRFARIRQGTSNPFARRSSGGKQEFLGKLRLPDPHRRVSSIHNIHAASW
ncbi:MAG: hypothetical protein MI924_36150 [Chloroflexales bacterium]|nr:hypothetical protein [Chloroflexales bacterium]